MLREELQNELKDYRNGAYITIEYQTMPTTRAKFKNQVTKHSKEVVRLGVDYSKMKINEGKEIGSLPYGQWVEEMVKFLIYNEDKNQYYLRVTTTGNKKHKIFSNYFLNGEPIEYSQLVEMGAIAPYKGAPSPIKNIKIENIIAIGKGEE